MRSPKPYALGSIPRLFATMKGGRILLSPPLIIKLPVKEEEEVKCPCGGIVTRTMHGGIWICISCLKKYRVQKEKDDQKTRVLREVS